MPDISTLSDLFKEIENHINRPRCDFMFRGDICPLCGALGTSLLPESKRRCRPDCPHAGCPGM